MSPNASDDALLAALPTRAYGLTCTSRCRRDARIPTAAWPPLRSRRGAPRRAGAARGPRRPLPCGRHHRGLPGETETEFESTFSLLSELDFAWIHAFPFSPRPGTRAAAMRPHVPERVAGARVDRLLALAGRGKAAYIGRWLGREVEMVVEHETADAPRIIGTTENYLKAEIIGNGNGDIPPGGAVRIVIQEESRSRHAEITAYRAATA